MSYKIEGFNSKEHKEAVHRYISNYVFTNQSHLVDELLKRQIFSWDEVENLYLDVEQYMRLYDIEDEQEAEAMMREDNFVDEPQEIFEWWAIDGWWANKLHEIGEPVIRNEYGDWWGRTTTGQAMSMDYSIQRVVWDLMSR